MRRKDGTVLQTEVHAKRLFDGRAGKMVQARAAGNGALIELVARYAAPDSARRELQFTRLSLSRQDGRWVSRTEVAPLVGQVRLAMTSVEMARVIKSPELIAIVDEIAAAEGVDTFLARAIIQAESAFNYKARSHAGALGLMQLMPATAERFGVTDPFDPRQNIEAGARLLRQLIERYPGNLANALAAYNAGTVPVDQHGGVPPYAETQNYVQQILGWLTNQPGTEQ